MHYHMHSLLACSIHPTLQTLWSSVHCSLPFVKRQYKTLLTIHEENLRYKSYKTLPSHEHILLLLYNIKLKILHVAGLLAIGGNAVGIVQGKFLSAFFLTLTPR